MKISLSNKGKASVRNVERVKNINIGRSRLTGAKRESSCLLYLSNIQTDCMSDDAIVQEVKDHSREVGISIMTVDVVHNRYCDYIVGVKIRVPISHESLAMEFDTWPDDIECRKWEKRSSRYGGGMSY